MIVVERPDRRASQQRELPPLQQPTIHLAHPETGFPMCAAPPADSIVSDGRHNCYGCHRVREYRYGPKRRHLS